MAMLHKVFIAELHNFLIVYLPKHTKTIFWHYYTRQHKYNWISHDLRNLMSFLHFKKREIIHGEVLLSVKLQAVSKSNTPPCVFFTFLNCKNGTKSLKASYYHSKTWASHVLKRIYSFCSDLLEFVKENDDLAREIAER